MKQAFLQKAFYSKLTGEGVTDEDYRHAHTVWKEFNIESTKDYHNLYNLSDVLFYYPMFLTNFRNICMNHYGLNPAWYFSAPCLAWDAALKITKVPLQLLCDPDMLLMIKSGIRGGIATISHRHAKANNEYMGTEFDQAEESKFITYLDANNLYDWSMSKQLAASGYEWMTDDELDDWKHLCSFLKVVLEYPEDLHDLHNDYPLSPERVQIGNIEKLIPNLNNKTNYVVYYENLKLYESLGFKITKKIHRSFKFDESAWLEEYININTKLRIEAKQSGNNFEVDFFKLMNNSDYGKTLENIKSMVDIRLITSDKVAQKLAAKTNYDRCAIFDENIISVHMRKTKLYFSKPVYVV